MKKVITYGTYDLLHYGHIRLLKRAKALGDYLIVGVTSDDYDRTRGKINVQQLMMERIEAIKATGLADEIIIEEYEGQKIDDIKRYGVDIFAIGSDWQGRFDYLNEYCEVIYLDRTEGISSSEIRSKTELSLGIVGDNAYYLNKFLSEDSYVNGITINAICTKNLDRMSENIKRLPIVSTNYSEMIKKVDVVYISSYPKKHYKQVKEALLNHKSVLCESPISTNPEECKELFKLAKDNDCILMEALRTAYSTAYSRLLLLLKGGKIGNIISVDATCSSIKDKNNYNSMLGWGSNALLPVFQILGIDYKSKTIISHFNDSIKEHDSYTKVNFIYDKAIASILVAEGAKSEGDLVISGTKGYIYVPSPWWKMDYFEVRYENPKDNKRFFYQLDGEGIRQELVAFTRAVNDNKRTKNIEDKVSLAICEIMNDFLNKKDMIEI